MTKILTLIAAALIPSGVFAMHTRPSQAQQLALAHVNLGEVDQLIDLLGQVQKQLYHLEAMRQEIQSEIGDSRCRANSLDSWIKTGKFEQPAGEDIREFAEAIKGLQFDLQGAGPAYRLRHNLEAAEKKLGVLVKVVALRSCHVSEDAREALGLGVELLKEPLADFRSSLIRELDRESRSRVAMLTP